MSEKKLTVFQRLNTIFGRDEIKKDYDNSINRYDLGNKEILKTTSQSDLDRAKLEAQQNMWLNNQWAKVDNELYQQTIHYETTRVASYSDFEAMEFYPSISAALDIMMEEATTPNDKGQVINIYSDSERVKAILEDLFKNRLDIHTSLPMWTRNTCKYGDNFVYLNIDSKKGIIGGRQLPNFEIERREGNFDDILYSRNRPSSSSNKDAGKVKFFYKTKDIEFNSWQIAHFRLLGDDRRLPYGTSILEKARRIWKQLLLSEDAMLVYRVTRAPERRVYKVYVGNIDDADVTSYVQTIANRFKRTPLIDPKTGQMDVRYNQLGYDQDIFIPVRDENAPTPIDTLPGAQNLDQIADIEYLQKNLFTALRVPKSFLGYEDAVGEGKNLALQDIRFSRTINRIQQTMIQELNKIAIIHLYLLGFEEDLDNFTLTLNNPSTQAEMLKVEHLQQKFTAYKDAVSDAGNGFAIMSMTRGKREILGWSDDEIKQDLIEQRIEKAAASELENTANVIKYTGIFDKVDTIYGDMDVAREGGGGAVENEDGGPTGGGGGFGGGSLGDIDFEDGEEIDLDDETDGGEDAIDMGADAESDNDVNLDDEINNTEESIKKKGKIIAENANSYRKEKDKKINKYKNNYLDKLTESLTKKPMIMSDEFKNIDNNSLKINETIESMIKEIDDKV